MKKDLDTLLKQALTPTDEPDLWLNQKILRQVKETESMDKRKVRRIPAAAIATALALGAGSMTAYASWKYLAPEKVAENLQDAKLTDAFHGKDAVLVNERQTVGGYHVTLLGMVSGKALSQYESTHNGEIQDDQTYCVTAIEYADGTPMPDTSSDAYGDLSFFVSPLMQGYDPNWYNAVTMRGGYSEFTENGILYRLTSCDNVEIFADHGLYLCVCDSTFYNQQAYDYDKATGVITRNKGYDGLNALFNLPIDASKADPDAAEKYLTSLEEEDAAGDTAGNAGAGDAGTAENSAGAASNDAKEVPYMASSQEVEGWISKLTPENIDEYAQRVESTVQVLTPDENGECYFRYEVKGRGSCSGSMLTSMYFADGTPGMSDVFGYSIMSGDGLDGLTVPTFTLNEDGTVTLAVYIPK